MNDAPLVWRTSTFSTQTGTCVEVAAHPDGPVLVRNSNRPDAGTLHLSATETASWLAGCRAGDLDDLTT